MARGIQKELAWLSITAPVATTFPYSQFKLCFSSLLAFRCSCSPLSPVLFLLFTPFLFPIPLILIPLLSPLLIPHFSPALIFSFLPCPTPLYPNFYSASTVPNLLLCLLTSPPTPSLTPVSFLSCLHSLYSLLALLLLLLSFLALQQASGLLLTPSLLWVTQSTFVYRPTPPLGSDLQPMRSLSSSPCE